MSEEHYPARSTGNEDIVAVDLIQMVDTMQSPDMHTVISARLRKGETLEEITDRGVSHRRCGQKQNSTFQNSLQVHRMYCVARSSKTKTYKT